MGSPGYEGYYQHDMYYSGQVNIMKVYMLNQSKCEVF